MSSQSLSVEVVIRPASHFIELGVLYASSPLVRGDVTTSIAQQVVRRPDNSIYSVSYRQPYPDEITA
jgi:hypothetical protein